MRLSQKVIEVIAKNDKTLDRSDTGLTCNEWNRTQFLRATFRGMLWLHTFM